MKTYGICGKQSARKHRKAGHHVSHVWGAPGRYQWVNSGDHRYVQLVGRMSRALAKPKPTAVVYDLETFTNGFQEPITGMKAEMAILDDIVDEPNHMDVPTSLGTVTITQGRSYWPKRRNQHSKPYHIIGFSRGMVQFVREFPHGDDDIVYSTPDAFVSLIGKPV